MTPRTAVRLTRPFTLLPPLLGIVSGAVCAFGSVHNPDPGHRLTWAVVSAAGEASAVICALELNPTQLRIADRIAVAPDDNRADAVPEQATIRDGQIVAENWKH